MRLKHTGFFKENVSVLDWESLRNDETETSYFIPYSVEKYLLRVGSVTATPISRAILEEVEKLGYKKIFSIGSGLASQEYQLKKFSDLSVIVSDITPSVLRLKSFNIFDDCFQLDALNDVIPADSQYLVLFPRIDTEFDDNQLKALFEKFHLYGIKHICFIPAQLLSIRILISEFKNRLTAFISKRPLVFCGYTRTENYFEKIWSPFYRIVKKTGKDKKFYILESINK